MPVYSLPTVILSREKFMASLSGAFTLDYKMRDTSLESRCLDRGLAGDYTSLLLTNVSFGVD
jgi:hypothetical protein